MSWTYRPQHFEPYEFRCRCGTCGGESVAAALVLRLDAAREAFGRPIYVTSGRRCEAHNLRVGGAERSRHLIGCAADIRPPEGVPLAELAALLALFFSAPADELLVYPSKGFVHIAVSRSLVRPQWSGGAISYR